MKKKKKGKIIIGIIILFIIGAIAFGGSDDDKDKKKIVNSSVGESGGNKELSGSGDSKNKDVSIDEQVLYEENGMKITATGMKDDSIWGAGVLLYAENNTGRNITIQVNNMSVNGFMVEPIFSCDIYNGKMCIDDITIFSEDLEKNGVESVDDIELSFHIFDKDSYNAIMDTDIIKFSTK